MARLLEGKTAIISGGGGGVARTFAREGARVFLAGRTREKLAEVGGEGAPAPEAAVAMIARMAVLRRAPRLADVAEVAAFLASDRAAGMTGTIANVTCGLVLT